MIEKLDYLQQLGINAIELLPVQEFNELEYYSPPAASAAVASLDGGSSGRFNFWGYSTSAFFAPMARSVCAKQGFRLKWLGCESLQSSSDVSCISNPTV